MIGIIKYSENFTANCICCGSGIDCYAIMMRTPRIVESVSITLCKGCLKELHTAVPEEVTKEGATR